MKSSRTNSTNKGATGTKSAGSGQQMFRPSKSSKNSILSLSGSNRASVPATKNEDLKLEEVVTMTVGQNDPIMKSGVGSSRNHNKVSEQKLTLNPARGDQNVEVSTPKADEGFHYDHCLTTGEKVARSSHETSKRSSAAATPNSPPSRQSKVVLLQSHTLPAAMYKHDSRTSGQSKVK